MNVPSGAGWRVAALLLLYGLLYFSYFPLAARVSKQAKPVRNPMVIFNLRHNVPSGQPGPKGVEYSIHIYSEGRITIFGRHGMVEGTASAEKIDSLLDVFKRERIMELSNTEIEEGVRREYKRRTGHEPGVYAVGTHREDWSELIIQHPTLGTNKLLLYGLKNWLRQNPDVKELDALETCIEKVYETAGEQRE